MGEGGREIERERESSNKISISMPIKYCTS